MPTEATDTNLQRALADAIVKLASLDEIRILLACGAKINDPVTQGLRPLHYAVWQKNLQAVNLLLIRGADINILDECGYSPLHLAVEHGYYEITRFLLEQGAKVDYREPTEEMFPRTTLCDEPLRLALRNKHYDIARLLLEHGADPNKRYFFGAEINLASDAESLELLLNYGANVESRDRAGMSPLMRVARIGTDIESVLILLSYAADVNAMTDARNDYRTVLHYAVLSGNLELVNLLLKQGAKSDLINTFGDPDTPSPLHLAILRGDPRIVKILLAHGADSNRATSIIGSPLHVACADSIAHRSEIMTLLLNAGADPNRKVQGEVGSNAILRPPLAELLASNENVSCGEIRLLLLFGARVVMKTQYRDPDGVLNCLSKVDENSDLFRLLCEAGECYNSDTIKKTNYLTPGQKEILLKEADTPKTLKSQMRIFFKRICGRRLVSFADEIEVPITLREYILYEHI